MSTTAYSQAYMLTKVLTADKREILLYLYEGAIGYLDRAIEARKIGDAREAAEATDRAIAVIVELSCSLDYNHNGALALRLDSIYNYMIEALTLSTRKQDLDALETCLSIMHILSDAWRQAVKTERDYQPAEPEGSLQISA